MAANAAYRFFSAERPILGLPAREVFPEVLAQEVFVYLDRALETGEVQSGREWHIQLDRGAGLEDIFIDFTISPVAGADGVNAGVNIMLVDITEQVLEKRAMQRRAAEAQRRYEAARGVVAELQSALLPTALPVLPRVQIAASYLLADADTAAGGDWFDAFPLPGGRLALIVGDVVGHGVAASATMGQLRVVLRERLAATGDLPAAIDAVDRIAVTLPGGRATTVCVVVLDPSCGTMVYCTAGHPPPLVIGEQEPRYLPATGAGPLGVGSRFPVSQEKLGTSEILLLYTDGILERPGRDVPQSTVELARVATESAADRIFHGQFPTAVDRLTIQTVELLTRGSGHSDDITMLAAQRVTAPARLDLRVPARSETLTELRVRLQAWLDTARVGAHDADAIRHAVIELAANVIDHAWIDSPDEHWFTVTADLTDTGHIHAQVTDRGRWREPAPSADRGLGLHLSSQLVDDLRLTHDEQGTTATITYRVHHRARLLSTADLAPAPAVRPAAQNELLLILDQPHAPQPRIRVDGPIDTVTADEFDRAVRTAGSAGVRTLTVDLTGVTHLASAGVAALHRLTALHQASKTRLRLYAPTGSPADMILSLVSLTHETVDPGYPENTIQ
ncbi:MULTISPECIES: SpoIIE family protein phosphatase [unclassified Actinoplanes]|uniref:SpoIIE family protein phosphatase n=1 Tax=unclassified Actinoplanes TaxID=2626549 RepID=UPI001E2AC8A2|nr:MULTISPECIES: SpoIIE family protein phosphatase [unclassified Actinoplanes]